MKMKIYSLKDYDFWSKYKSRWGDMDGLRHLNHAAYLIYMESARIEFYQHLGIHTKRWDLKESTILVSIKIDYLQQAFHPCQLLIGQRISRVGNKSFDILTSIFRGAEERPLLQAIFTLVAFNYDINSSISVPEVFRENCRPIQDG
jgi:acyl-CoA thioester hydrolase